MIFIIREKQKGFFCRCDYLFFARYTNGTIAVALSERLFLLKLRYAAIELFMKPDFMDSLFNLRISDW